MNGSARSGRWVALLFASVLLSVVSGCRPAVDPPILYALDESPFRALRDIPRARVFIFYRTDCPVSNRYVPEIRRLHEEFTARRIDFRLVFVDPEQPASEIEQHLGEFDLRIPALRDPFHDFVDWTGARITPEAALVTASGELAYRGRIDDRFIDFGQERAQPTRRDLREALQALLAGQGGSPTLSDAVGCYISDLRKSL